MAPERRVVEAVEVAQRLADGAGVLRQTLDVLEGHVDDADGAGLAVQVATGEASEAGGVGDAALAVRMKVRTRREAAGQRAALDARRPARSQLHGRPENGKVSEAGTQNPPQCFYCFLSRLGPIVQLSFFNGFINPDCTIARDAGAPGREEAELEEQETRTPF